MSKLKLKEIHYENKINSLDEFKKMVEDPLIDPSQKESGYQKYLDFFQNMLHTVEYSQATTVLLMREMLQSFQKEQPTDREQFLDFFSETYDLEDWQKDSTNSAEFLFSYLMCKQKTGDFVELKTNFKNAAGKQLCISGYRVTNLKESDETNRANKQKFLQDSYSFKEIQKLITAGLFYPQESIYQRAESNDLQTMQLADYGQLSSILSRKLLASDVQKNYAKDEDFFQVYSNLVADKKLLQDALDIGAKFCDKIVKSVKTLYEWHNICNQEHKKGTEGTINQTTLECADELIENAFSGAKELHKNFGLLVETKIMEQGKIMSIDEFYKMFGTYGDNYANSLKTKKAKDYEKSLEEKDTSHMS